jgi:protein SCO1/2
MLVAVCCAIVPSEMALGQSTRKLADDVGFDQRLGNQVPMQLRFRDDSGRETRLDELFQGRPVIVVPMYYRCPMLCNALLNGLARSLKPLSLVAGKDFDVVVYSIDPGETSEAAHRKKAALLKRYGRPGGEGGWHFLAGDAASIAKLSAAIGFRYSYNPLTGLYAHAAGIVVATSAGRIARYFYGVDFPARELESQINGARANRVGSPIRRLLLLCYDYDAATGRYTLSVLVLMRVLGSMTVLALLTYLVVMIRRERIPHTAKKLRV